MFGMWVCSRSDYGSGRFHLKMDLNRIIHIGLGWIRFFTFSLSNPTWPDPVIDKLSRIGHRVLLEGKKMNEMKPDRVVLAQIEQKENKSNNSCTNQTKKKRIDWTTLHTIKKKKTTFKGDSATGTGSQVLGRERRWWRTIALLCTGSRWTGTTTMAHDGEACTRRLRRWLM